MPNRRWAAWLAPFVALFALTSLWAFATPEFSGPDEADHVSWAAAVVRFQLRPSDVRPSDGGLVRVPAAYGAGRANAACFLLRTNVSARCAPAIPERGAVEVRTRASGYPIAYYLAVGWPSLVVRSGTGVLLMRLTSAVLVAVLLYGAWRVLGASSLALTAACTPIVLYLGGVVNPSCVEISGSILVWCAAREALLDPRSRRAWRWLTVGAVVVLLARSTGPLWLAAIVLTSFVRHPQRVRGALRSPPARTFAATTALAAVFAIIWTATAEMTFIHGDAPHRSVASWVSSATHRLPVHAHAMVTGFGYQDAVPPGWVAALWVAGAAVVALSFRSRLDRQVVGAVIVLAVLAIGSAVIGDAAAAPHIGGLFWQGRYSLPLCVGLPILVLGDDGARRPRVALAGVTAMTVAFAAALLYVMARYAATSDLARAIAVATGTAGFALLLAAFGTAFATSPRRSPSAG